MSVACQSFYVILNSLILKSIWQSYLWSDRSQWVMQACLEILWSLVIFSWYFRQGARSVRLSEDGVLYWEVIRLERWPQVTSLMWDFLLTHWCLDKMEKIFKIHFLMKILRYWLGYASIVSGNGLAPDWCQAITWSNTDKDPFHVAYLVRMSWLFDAWTTWKTFVYNI